MTASIVPQDDFLMAVWSIRVLNYSDVVVATLLVYDSLLRFQQDATFLAQANTNVPKILYIGARYMPLLMPIPNLMFDQVRHMKDVDCQTLGDLAAAFSMMVAFCAECIFVLRTCAMWEVKRPLRWIMFMIVSGMAVAGLIIFSFVPKQYVVVPDISTCQPFQTAKTPGLLAVFLTLLMLEFVLVIFTTIRAVKNYRSTPIPLLTRLLTHHIFYYGCGLLFSTINVLCLALFEYENAAVFFSPPLAAL